MAVVSPADAIETKQATAAIVDWPGPVYMRLGRYPVPCFCDCLLPFEMGVAQTVREGGDVAILATGHMVCKSLEAAELLSRDHIEARVVNVSTIKPLDEAAVRDAAASAGLLVTVEEHSIIGGLGSAVAEVVSAVPASPPLLRLGVRDVFGESGLADELLEKHRLTPSLIAEDVRGALS
jgi:transketolase